MPNVEQGEDLEKALNLLLHELRTPLSVAQGYLRLLLEDRLSDSKDRQRALAQSMDALGRISDLCAGAGEFANAAPSVEAHRYPVAELMRAVTTEAQARGLGTCVHVQDPLPDRHVRALTPEREAAAIAVILLAARRNASAQQPEMSAGVDDGSLVITTGNSSIRARLLAPMEHEAFNPWRGGSGLLVALAVKHLRETGARVWTLAGETGAVAIAIPLDLQA